jgi:hypothetical protein
MKILKKMPAIVAMAVAAAVGVNIEAQAQGLVVKKQPGNATVSSSVKYPSASYTLTCWQEGKEILRNAGTGRIALGKEFGSRSVSITLEDNGGASVTVFSTDSAFCRLQTSARR